MAAVDLTGIRGVLFDFSGVVGDFRVAHSGDPGTDPYVVDVYPAVVEGVRDLRRAGFVTGLITNHDRESFGRYATQVALPDLFDVDVFASDLGVSKPHPQIFEHAVGRMGRSREQVLFLDDSPRNVDAAEAMGLVALVVESPTFASEVIRELLSGLDP